MSLWEKTKAELIDIIEWTDDTNDTMVWRFPRYENEIKFGAQLVVRQSQAAVFVNMGEIADVFPPGQHQLTTRNLPLLSTLQGWKFGFHSPFKAEVYFVNTRNFVNLKWGTRNPLMLRDPEFGPVRLRSFGTYVVKVGDPATFVKEIVGTSPHFTVDGVAAQLTNLIVTRFSDMLGESRIQILDLAASYDELSDYLTEKIAPEFLEYGLQLTKLLVENIALPPEVEAALDKKSSMGIVGDLNNYLKYQSANAMEAAANSGGEAAAGIGMGMGFAMASQLGKMMASPQEPGREGGAPPPPLPGGEAAMTYYVGKDGKATGPFAEADVVLAIRQGVIGRKTLLWREGLADWQSADAFAEFAATFSSPPSLPK